MALSTRPPLRDVLSAWLPATTLLGASVLATGLLAAAPADPTGPVAAVFPPSWSATDSFAAAASAGSLILSPGGLANIVIVQADDSGLPGRLAHAGAWLVLDATRLGYCAPASNQGNPLR